MRNFIIFIFFITFSQKVFGHKTELNNSYLKKTEYKSIQSLIYIDRDVQSLDKALDKIFFSTAQKIKTLQIFTHGKSGELLINGKWKSKEAILIWLKKNYFLANYNHINIYGCEFAKGKKGLASVNYLQQQLGISVSASTNITGKDGDWNLEVGNPIEVITLPHYNSNLQCTLGQTNDNIPVYWLSNGNLDAFTTINENIQNDSGGKLFSDGANVKYNGPDNFKGGDTIFIRGNYQGDSRRGPIVLSGNGFNSGPLFNDAFPLSAWATLFYVIPANIPEFPFLNITGETQNGVAINIDVVKLVRSHCISCNINTIPSLTATSITNACPVTSYNLSTISANNAPSGSFLSWHTGTPATNANKITNINSAIPVGNLFYATFYNSANMCYSGINGSATKKILANGNFDCDAVQNSDDLDDDNDGVLDITESKYKTCEETYPLSSRVIWNNFTANNINGLLTKGGKTVGITATTTTLFSSLKDNSSFTVGFPYTGCADPFSTVANSGISIASSNYTVTFTFSKPVLNPSLILGSFNGGISFPQNVFVNGLQKSGLSTNIESYITSIPGTENVVSVIYPGVYNSISFSAIGSDNTGSVILNIDEINSTGTLTYTDQPTIPYSSYNLDTDNDGLLNVFDLDSDGDGCSDAMESNATTETTPNFKFPPPYGTNGFVDAKEIGTTGNINYTSTYENYALNSSINTCSSFDTDLVPIQLDIDDDNDGIPDFTEAPNCYYSESESSIPLLVTTQIPNTGAIANLYDNITSTTFAFTNLSNYNGLTIFEITPKSNIALSAIKLILNSATNPFNAASNALVVQGFTGVNWVNLTSPTPLATVPAVSSNTITFNINTAIAPYQKYRIQGVASGTLSSTGVIQEIVLMPNGTYNPNLFPKAICTTDNDGDGIINTLDLDSDGDGCSDALEAGATPITNANYQFPAPHGVNGLADALETTADNGVINYFSTYNPNATSKFLSNCKDSDGDGIFNFVDIDDDNDGIPDGDEAPTCYYTTTEANILAKVSTGLASSTVNNIAVTPGSDIPTMHNNISAATPGQDHIVAAAQTTTTSSIIYSLEYPTPVKLSSVSVAGVTSWGTGSLAVLEGSTDGVNFPDVLSAPVATSTTVTKTWNVTINPNNYYQYYRIRVSTVGSTTPSFTNFEVTSIINTAGYIPSAHPKPVCNTDTDNDGITNNLDLDSDGDGCYDILEAGVTGATSNTNTFSDSLAVNPATPTIVGANGLKDALETTADNGVINYFSTYNPNATSKFLSNCKDSDGDGIFNFVDIDDDNDGIPDGDEAPTCYYTTTEANTLAKVSTGLASSTVNSIAVTPGSDIPTMHNNISAATPGQDHIVAAAQTTTTSSIIYSLEYPTPVKLSSVSVVGVTSWGTGSLAVLEGSTDGVNFPDVLSAPVATSTTVTKTWNVTINPNNYYQFYRIRVSTVGSTTPSFTNFEVTSIINTAGYIPSAHPKPVCNTDTDNDGITNNLDLDSDGDGCYDILEAGVTGATSNTNTFSDSLAVNPATPTIVGTNGLKDALETTADNGVINYFSTYNPNATSKFLSNCKDSDGDGIFNYVDIDDDNDGIPDEDEAPTCYYTTTEANALAKVSTGLASSTVNSIAVTPGSDIPSLRNHTSVTTPGQDHIVAAAQTTTTSSIIYSLEYPTPVRLSSVIVAGVTSWGTGSLAVLEGSTDGVNFPDVLSAPVATSTTVTKTWNVTINPNNYYQFYRIRVSTVGSTTPSFTNFEVTSIINTAGYIPSAHPKPVCNTDTDNDGITNNFDLDSDGDGCYDILEASVTGATINTNTFSDSLAVNPATPTIVGANGLKDALETTADNGVINYTSTYNLHATNPNIKGCTDTDGDNIPDVKDIDDDNDGVPDLTEMGEYCNINIATPISATPVPFGSSTFTLNNSGMTGTGLSATTTGPATTTDAAYLADGLPAGTIEYTLAAGSNASYLILWAQESITVAGGEDPMKDFTVTITYDNGSSTYTTQSYSTIKPTGANTPNFAQKFDFGRFFPNVTKLKLNITNGWTDETTNLGSGAVKGVNWVSTEGNVVPGQYNLTISEFRYGCYELFDFDTDSDGIPNRLDLDSDGDGCSDAFESGATSNLTSNYQFPAPHGVNGLADAKETALDNGIINYTSTYNINALNATAKTCTDSDGDGSSDIVDIDDDNDGILDVIENCPTTSSSTVLTRSSNTNATFSIIGGDNNVNPSAGGMTYWVGQGSQDESIQYDFLSNKPTKIVIGQTINITNGEALEVYINDVLFPLNATMLTDSDASNTFSNGALIGTSTGSPTNFTALNINYPSGITKFRVRNNPLAAGNGFEIASVTVNESIDFSCIVDSDKDTDNDGVPNRLDLDSDGDGCTDAVEAGTYNQVGVTTSYGLIRNGFDGIVTNTDSIPNAIINGPYGNNGFANSLQATPDTNSYKSTYTYNLATDSTQHACCPIISNNNITGNQNYCNVSIPLEIVGSTPTLKPSNTPSYIWLSSTTSPITGFTVISGATNKDYTPPSSNQTKYYKRIVFITSPSGCTGDTTNSVTITINPIPIASISYNGSPFYPSGTANVIQTGQTGGTYSSNDSLVINSITGQINLNESNPGNYTIKYLFTGNGGCIDSAFTNIQILASLDTIELVPSCPTCPVNVCVVGDDIDDLSGATYTTCGTPTGYTLSGPDANGCVTLTPDGTTQTGDVETCVVVCNDGICDTTYIILHPPVTPDTVEVTASCPSCPINTCVVGDDIYNLTGATYTTCAAPAGYTITGPDANGCITLNPDGSLITTELETCIVICNGGICDTTYVIILFPPITPDTVELQPSCPSCPVNACVVGDDINNLTGATYTTCGTPTGYILTGPDANGCVTLTPNGTTQIGDVETCIVVCNGGICDTTYIILHPPVTPDTVELQPSCPSCPVNTCVVGDDIDDLSGATYSTCGTPTGYTLSGPDANGCVTLTPDGTTQTGDVETCIVVCNNGICDTTFIILHPPATPDTVEVTPACPACPVNICVIGDDIYNLTGATYSTCGTPAGYTLTGPDTNGCVTLTPNGTTQIGDVETCVIICNNGICDTTFIILHPPVTPDTVEVTGLCSTCPVITCVVGDDIDDLTGATYTTCGTPEGYIITGPDANGCITITPNGTLVRFDVETCIVVCNNGICDTTYVIIHPPVSTDTIEISVPCPTCPVNVCVVGDDIDDLSGATFTTCGTPTGYTLIGPDANGCVTLTPDGTTQTGDVETCIVVCNDGICDTTYVIIHPPATPDTVEVTASCPSCPINTCVVGDDIYNLTGATYTTCAAPAGYTITGPDANGCITLNPDGSLITTELETCIVICNGGICDTTYVIILFPPITPDTVELQPSCPSCPVNACVVGDDINNLTGATYTTCGTPTGYILTGPDANGCVTLTPNGTTQIGDVETCIVVCNGGICDTTYIILHPPVTPDTVELQPSCPSCPVNTCVVGDDIDDLSGATYSTCGTPTGYTLSGPDANGCVTLTPDGTTQTGDVETCIVVCNNGICDTTYIILHPPATPDTVEVTPACPACPVNICVIGDDIYNLTGATYSTCGTPAGYTLTGPDTNGCVTLTPNGTTQIGDVETCVIVCNNGICDTTFIILHPPVTSDTLTVTPACPSCPVNTCVVGDDIDDLTGATFTTCGTPTGYTLNGPDANGCVTLTPNGTTQTGDVETCIVVCNNGICDTTYIILHPPVTPDTLTVTPACPTCPVITCVVGDDIDDLTGATYSTCGTPTGYTLTGPDANGCVTLTPNGTTQTGDVETCVIVCNNGICDTTYVILHPPVTPDTLTVTPSCPSCPVITCVVGDDIDDLSGATYSTCGTPTGYTLTGPDANGCVTLSPDGTTQTGDVETCVIVCNNGICDTTYIILHPPLKTLVARNDINQTSQNIAVGGNLLTNDIHDGTGSVSGAAIDLDGNGTYETTLPIDGSDYLVLGVGAISINPNGNYIFTPDPLFVGQFPFVQYTLSISNGQLTKAILDIDVIQHTDIDGQQPPVAKDDTNTTDQNTPVSGMVITNDSDPDTPRGDLIITSITGLNASGGTIYIPFNDTTTIYDADGKLAGDIVFHENGTYTFIPEASYFGTVPLNYVLTDPEGNTDGANLDILVISDPSGTRNSTYANDDANSGPQGIVQNGNVITNDNDPENDVQTIASAKMSNGTPISINLLNALPSGGTFILFDDGNYEYRPDKDFIGTEVITYQVCDNLGACANATLYLTTTSQKFDYGDLPLSYGEAMNKNSKDEDGNNVPDFLNSVWGGSFVNYENESKPGNDNFDDGILGFPSTLVVESEFDFNIELNSNTLKTVYYGFWIDWDNDSIFDDFYEGSAETNGPITVPISITTPSNATENISYRLRISEVPLVSNDFQGMLSNGETEDYTLTVVLPLNLLSFNVLAQDLDGQLFWTTSSEINVDKFEIERSYNGSQFTKIEEVKATNAQGINNYNFSDINVGKNRNSKVYYRLKMKDRDGRHNYSKVRFIEFKSTIEYILFPNPSTGALLVKSNQYNNSQILSKIIILDSFGKEVENRTYESGKLLLLEHLSDGVYFIQLIDQNEKVIESKKWVKIK